MQCLSVKNIQKQGVVIQLLMPSSFYDILVSRYNFNIIQGLILRVNGLFKPLNKSNSTVTLASDVKRHLL